MRRALKGMAIACTSSVAAFLLANLISPIHYLPHALHSWAKRAVYFGEWLPILGDEWPAGLWIPLHLTEHALRLWLINTSLMLAMLAVAFILIHFDLVSPEKLLFSGNVHQVDVPGAEGDFGVLAGHAPLMATLRPGIMTIHRDGGPLRMVVIGGFAEVNPEGLTVLADQAVPLNEFDRNTLTADIKTAEGDVAAATDPARRDKLAHKLEQLRTLQTAIGS
jgi:F-type H+-transporting ATPase subunit epsilon